MKRKKKGYSEYENSNAKKNNRIPVQEGSVIVAKLSDYEELPSFVKDHKRESITVLKEKNGELGVVYIHGKNDITGKSRKKKVDSGIWQEIEKNGQEVYVDLDIRITDSKGNPIRQGKVFQNTGVMIDKENMEKVENHLFMNKGRSHNVRNAISENKRIRDKKKKANK